MKRLYYVNEIVDKLLIKIVKLNEDLNIMKDFKRIRASIKNYFNMRKIHTF